MFGHALGLKGARALSAEFGECLALHIDESSGTYRCERAVGGEVRRRVYASDRDKEYDSEGQASAGEPQVPWLEGDAEARALGLSGTDVLGFAKAWGTDPHQLFSGREARAFVASRKPMVTKPARRRSSVVAMLVGAMLVLLVLGATGAGAWWLAQSDQEVVAVQFCENQWGCASCVGCTSSEPHPCAEAFAVCEGDADCFALMQCLAGCQDLGSRAGFTAPGEAATPCFARCRGAHAAGLEPYCAFTSCSYRDACASMCTDPGHLALAACE